MIPWYYEDSRFEPGTTADMSCFRLKLRERKQGWVLLASFRKSDKSLAQDVKVIEIGHCSLKDAQNFAENWINGEEFSVVVK